MSNNEYWTPDEEEAARLIAMLERRIDTEAHGGCRPCGNSWPNCASSHNLRGRT